jgi:dephospho-CoA kinase
VKSTIIGLTGGIGSGKSTVAHMFEALGATVVDADAIVHQLQAPNAPLLGELAAAFGSEIIRDDGSLDREALGEIVFSDETRRLELNRIVHPAVGVEFQRRVAAAIAEEVPVVVLDIPLLFEGRKSGKGTAALMDFDAIVVVWVPEQVQLERTMARDDCSEETARQRMEAQLPLDEKREEADHVIENDGPLSATEAQVRAVYEAIRAAAP